VSLPHCPAATNLAVNVPTVLYVLVTLDRIGVLGRVFPFPKFQDQFVFELQLGLPIFEAGVLELTKVTI
jgi:hypothetical protein